MRFVANASRVAESRSDSAGPRLSAALGSAVVAVVLAALPCAAQTPAAAPPPPAQQRVVEQMALARARTEMLDRVRRLPIVPRVAVGDWLVRDANLDRSFRLWVRGRSRQGSLRWYSDGVCEADVRVEPAELRDALLKLLSEYPTNAATPRVDESLLKDASRSWPILWTTGQATLSKAPRPSQPTGWEDVSAEGMELARVAATADAYAALLEEAGRLKLSAARRLREFLAASDAARAAVADDLQRVAKVKVEFAPDQVAVVEARLGMRELLRILTSAHQEHYRGDDFAAADFREMALLTGQNDVIAMGLAPPPNQALLRPRYTEIELDVPDWAATTLTAVGRCEPAAPSSTPAAEDQPSAADARAATARLDGIERLDRQIMKLALSKNVTVADYLSYYQDLKGDVVLFLSGARASVAPVTPPDGTVEVRLELPLRRLWEILRRTMPREEVEPAPEPARAGPTTSSAPAAEDTP